MKRMIFAAVIGVAIGLIGAAAFADEARDLSSQKKPSKSEQIRAYAQSCFDRELELFESTKGRLPTDEEADYIIDACANPKLK